MRSKFRTTVSASAIAMGIALSAQSAQAADVMEQAYGPDWYVSVFGGASFARAQLAYNTSQYEIKLKDGFSVGAAIGRQLGNGFRAESELSYMKNSNKKERGDNGSFDAMDGDTAAVFILGNIWKDIRLSDTIQPYIGAGLGTAIVSHKEEDEYNVDDTAIALAGQMGAGVRVALSDRLALDVGYRLKAAIDASLEEVDDDDNGVFSYYSHTAQVGLSYAFGDDSHIMPAASGEPSDWYVSLFAGGVQTDTNWNYSDGDGQYIIDHKLGFTIGGAIGTHIAPGLRSELELSYARSALNSYSSSDGNSDPAGGHLEQGFLLANIWKDFDAGMLTSYIGGGIGFGLAHFDNADLNGEVISDDTGFGFAGQFGFGARMAVSDNLSVDLGYRFKSIVDALIIGGNDWTDNSEIATTNHVVQLGLDYGLGAGEGDGSNAGVPDSRYVSLFGGLVLPVDTHASYDSSDYLVSFKNGFTLGAAVGQNLTETLRGEIEVAFQTYDVDDVQQQGAPETGDSGTVNSYFLMANMWRDMEIGGFHPYVGGGLGVGLMDVQIFYSTDDGVDSTNPALAAQVGSGVRFDVSDNLTVDVGYRFKAVTAVITEGRDGDDHNSSSYFTHAGQVGVSWKF